MLRKKKKSENPEPWFTSEIASGLQRLLVLSPPGKPAADMVGFTAQQWSETLWKRPIYWESEQDVIRLQTAFTELCSNLERWPTPKQLMVYLPKRPQLPELPPPALSREEQKQNLRKLKAMMGEIGA